MAFPEEGWKVVSAREPSAQEWADLRFAWRMLAGRPFFSLVAVLMLGLGIGANTTVFTWVQAVGGALVIFGVLLVSLKKG